MSDPIHVKGWHPTGTFGAIAAAAACAQLRGLDAGHTAHALGIAASMAAGFIANFGSMTKPFHAGRAAQSGVLAARLAQAGMTASEDALESDVGFLRVIAPRGEADVKSLPQCGARWFLRTHGLGFKLFPMCYGAHRALDGIFALLRAHPFRASDVERIEVHATKLQFTNLVHTDPKTGLDAKFSMEFAMAAPILMGRVTRAEFTDEVVRGASVRALMARVHRVFLDPTAPGVTPQDRIVIHLKDGRRLDQLLQVPMGHADRPPSREALWMKFEDCVAGALNGQEAARMFDSLQDLPALGSVDDLAACSG
jgi:2-methylcitrate dehydratase PrpD